MKDWIYDSAPYCRGNPALGQWGSCRSESLARGHTSCSRTPSTSSTVLQTFAPAVLHLSSNNALPFSYLALRASTIRDFSACLQYIGSRKNSSTMTAQKIFCHQRRGHHRQAHSNAAAKPIESQPMARRMSAPAPSSSIGEPGLHGRACGEQRPPTTIGPIHAQQIKIHRFLHRDQPRRPQAQRTLHGEQSKTDK